MIPAGQEIREGTAAELAALVDAFLPGDESFPPASAVGTDHLLAERWPDRADFPDAKGLVALLVGLRGSFAALDKEGRASVLRTIERERPDVFGLARQITYLSYYQAPEVVAAIRLLGHQYNSTPQPAGYLLPPFDAERDAPKHKRGAYVPTDAVKPVDLTNLHLASTKPGVP
jgi:hypothetical protein